MSRVLVVVAFVLGFVLAVVGIRTLMPTPGPSVPEVAASVDYIRQIGDLAVLRASVKEIVTSNVGEARWFTTQGKLAIICHFDIKYKYDLRRARIAAGSREDGTRYCLIRLPKHEYEIATREIRFYDERDGTWLGFALRTPPDERTRALDAARAQAEQQAKTFLGSMEAEIQNSAKATLGQIARAFGFTEITFEFDQ